MWVNRGCGVMTLSDWHLQGFITILQLELGQANKEQYSSDEMSNFEMTWIALIVNNWKSSEHSI